MIYRVLADAVMVLHGGFLVFFVVGGFLAWRWPRVIWAHLAVGVWNLAIVVIDYECPITGLEKELREHGGEPVYSGGFIAHYLDGPVWPEGATPTVEKVGFALLVISYGGFFVVRRFRARSVEPRT